LFGDSDGDGAAAKGFMPAPAGDVEDVGIENGGEDDAGDVDGDGEEPGVGPGASCGPDGLKEAVPADAADVASVLLLAGKLPALRSKPS
jgi:hypothetical protein